MRRLAASLLLAALAACGTPSSASRPPAAAVVAAPAEALPPSQPRPEVLLARARALRAEGDVAGAQERLEVALQAAPDSDELRLELADLIVAEGREPYRAAVLLEGVRVRDGARWHLANGRLAELRGDDRGAEAAYARALAEEDDPDVRLRRALVLERLGRFDEAAAQLELLRAARPDDALVRARLAERHEAAGRLAEAEVELREAAEAQPERAAGWERLARFYRRAGREAEARDALARARDALGRTERALRPLLPSKR